jgi:adhesin/invasin
MRFIFKIILVLFFLFIPPVLATADQIKDKFFSSIEKFLDTNFEHTDFTIKSTEETKPEISIETFKPITETDDSLTFFQGSLFMHDGDRETINLGFGKRFFSDDETIMYGLNTFYDHELDYDHSRTSLGGEIKSSFLELNLNQYFSNSGSKTGKNNKAEEALDGYDLEFGAQVPYIPSATFYTKSFKFDNPTANDFEGYEYSSKIEVPNSGLTFHVGHTDYDHHTDEWFFKVNYSTNKINNKSFVSSEAFEKTSTIDRKYEKVRRDNIIVKSGAAFTVKAGGF